MNEITDTLDPRLGIGGNNPPLAKIISEQENFAQAVTDFLADEYKSAVAHAEELLTEARALPKEIDNDATKGKFTSIIKRIRDHAKKLDAFHEKEKTPYLRGSQAVDQFYFGWIDKLARRTKTNNPGAADVLNARLTVYDDRVEAEKRAKLAREAAEAERKAEEARQAQIKKAAEAEAARVAADRALKPEKIAEKEQVATVAEAVADAAKVEAIVTENRAEETHIATLAKSSDLMRHRDEETGTLSTRAMEKYAEVEDRNKLDYTKLAPFFNMDAVEKALRGWAANTGHSEQMEGARIGKRPKSVVR